LLAIQPASSLSATAEIPASKSYTNRIILSQGEIWSNPILL